MTVSVVSVSVDDDQMACKVLSLLLDPLVVVPTDGSRRDVVIASDAADPLSAGVVDSTACGDADSLTAVTVVTVSVAVCIGLDTVSDSDACGVVSTLHVVAVVRSPAGVDVTSLVPWSDELSVGEGVVTVAAVSISVDDEPAACEVLSLLLDCLLYTSDAADE